MEVPSLVDLDWRRIVANLLYIVTAYLLVLPIGWDRERSGAGLGLRTIPLVAVASCGYILVARSLGGSNPDAESRVLQGLLGGIGFVDGGAILKEGAVCAARRPRPASGTPGRSGWRWPTIAWRSRWS